MSPSDIAIASLVVFSATFTILYYRILIIKEEHIKGLVNFVTRLLGRFWNLILQGIRLLGPSHRDISTRESEIDLSREPLISDNMEGAAENQSTPEHDQGIDVTQELDDSSSQYDASSSNSDAATLTTVDSSNGTQHITYTLINWPSDEATIDTLIAYFEDYTAAHENLVIELDTHLGREISGGGNINRLRYSVARQRGSAI
ncbi:hypothetical protein N7478_007622 [Penicillium angulare]|uniref:uncharacterized protein n=1 Tax=Penicillium angulare TaxID=116970 RepID=UPI002541659A|nr:uncharacterized protein N7478_007622 [Penicillium angulare]KAJ5272497.1 hypothetical protein N7478_007622 [Penicillium angulare]